MGLPRFHFLNSATFCCQLISSQLNSSGFVTRSEVVIANQLNANSKPL